MVVLSNPLIVIFLASLFSGSNADVEGIEFGQHQIDQILDSLNQTSNELLSSTVPELKNIDNVPEQKLKECYDSSVDQITLDIFRQPLGEIVRSYFNHFRSSVDSNQISSKTQILLENIRKVAGWVLECALNTDPNYRPMKVGLTQMSIYSSEDLELFDDRSFQQTNSCYVNAIDRDNAMKEEKFDWRDRGIVSPVKTSGDLCICGRIFAAVATMESAWMNIIKGTGIVFAEQALIDCGYSSGKIPEPCHIGFISQIFEASEDLGLVREKDYTPYTGKIGDCKKPKVLTKPTGYCKQNVLDEILLRTIVHKYGPAAIGISASSDKFLHLKGPWTGSSAECGTQFKTSLTLVGWDAQYFILKNQWGTSWGEKGYLYLPKKGDDASGMCGIFNQPAWVPFF